MAERNEMLYSCWVWFWIELFCSSYSNWTQVSSVVGKLITRIPQQMYSISKKKSEIHWGSPMFSNCFSIYIKWYFVILNFPALNNLSITILSNVVPEIVAWVHWNYKHSSKHSPRSVWNVTISCAISLNKILLNWKALAL